MRIYPWWQGNNLGNISIREKLSKTLHDTDERKLCLNCLLSWLITASVIWAKHLYVDERGLSWGNVPHERKTIRGNYPWWEWLTVRTIPNEWEANGGNFPEEREIGIGEISLMRGKLTGWNIPGKGKTDREIALMRVKYPLKKELTVPWLLVHVRPLT